ncbi:MAG: proline dehydrogenase family protein, partial [Proteobacteria bacterium]|nr:proline dehydrogenase family protein [Pseudomonadota bacterium]
MLSDLRKRLSARRIAAEQICVEELVREAGLLMTPGDRDEVVLRAIDLVTACRENSHRSGTLDAFLHQFGLNNAEGVALMCLAEALLRIPDEDTADRLIAEKIRRGDWQAHLGESESVFVNASIWGLMLTGRLVTLDPDTLVDPDSWVRKLVSRAGEPIVRSAVMQAMRIIGGQFVLGRSIDEAMARGVDRNARFSFDMLGEGARTDDAAEHYFSAYLRAIDEIAERETHVSPDLTNGISIKLSALHPRYEARQRERVMRELTPRLKALALAAKQSNLGINIDAEEAARLDLSLDLFETLAR